MLMLLTSVLSLVVSGALPCRANDMSHCAVGKWDAAPKYVPLPMKDGPAGASLDMHASGGTVDGPISGNGDMGLVAGAPAAQRGKLLLYVDAMQFHDPLESSGQSYGGKRGVGLLTVAPALAAPNGTMPSFEATQWMANATVETRQAWPSGWTVHTRSYVAATENVLVTRVWWTICCGRSGAGLRQLQIETNPLRVVGEGDQQMTRQSAGRGGVGSSGSQWFNRSLGRDFYANYRHPRAKHKEHKVRIAVVTTFLGVEAAHIAPAAGASSGSVLSLRAGQVATVVTAMHTNRDFLWARDGNPDEPLQSTGQLSHHHSSSPAALASLEAAHLGWWKDFWAKSGISLSLDPDGSMSVAQRFWYGSTYMLAVSNRYNGTKHTPPAGLWRNFYTNDMMPWPEFTTDINTESPYFGCAASNHAELELAMIDLHDQFLPMGRTIASAAYNCSTTNGVHGPGVLLPVEIAAYGGTLIWYDEGLKSNGLLMAMVHINHGRLTGEIDGMVYNYIREIALFWQCYLVKVPKANGSYVYEDLNDCPYEECAADGYVNGNEGAAEYKADNPTNALAMLRTCLEAALEFSVILGRDGDLRPVWQDILAHLVPYPTAVIPGGNGDVIFTDGFATAPGNGLPPPHDRQMPGEIQVVYPAQRVSSSSFNRTLYRTAKNMMDFLDMWHGPMAGSDGDCVTFMISTRLNYNQTEIYPSFVQNLGPGSRPGFPDGNLYQNGLNRAQNIGGVSQ